MGDLFVRIEYPDEGITKAMKFSQSKTIRQLLFQTATTFQSAGCSVEDVINFNFKYYPESQVENSLSEKKNKKKEEEEATEPYFLKKVKTLESYNYSNGVKLRFERAGNFNKAVEEVRADSGNTSRRDTGKLQLSGENEKVKFLTKGRFTRTQAATEIVTTEKTYVEQLQAILTNFVEPSIKRRNLITNETIRTMFNHMQTFCDVHKKMLVVMEERISRWSNATELGDVFGELDGCKEIYGDYCLNYEYNFNQFVQLCDESTHFNEWVKICEEKEELNLNSIGAYLILPVQRIPRYRLLFEQLLKLTPKSHPDHNKLQETLQTVNDIASYVNNYEVEDRKKLQEIEANIEGATISIVQPGRKLIKQGILKKISSRATQERMVYLFNDAIIYCTSKKTPYQFKGHIPLTARIWMKGVSGTKIKNAIQIVGDNKTFTFVAANTKEKFEWSSEINGVLGKLMTASPSAETKNELKVHDRGGLWRILNKSSDLRKF